MIVARYLAEAVFLIFILMTLMGGVLAVRVQTLMHAVLGLAISLVGVGGLYFFLNSPFLTFMQILIYVGAVCVMLVFGIMVGETPEDVARKNLRGKNLWLAIVAGLSGFGLLSAAVVQTTFKPVAERVGDFSIAYLGETLLYRYCLAFELISVILLTAIVGAIILSRGGRKEAADAK